MRRFISLSLVLFLLLLSFSACREITFPKSTEVKTSTTPTETELCIEDDFDPDDEDFDPYEQVAYKPVIYLYPERPTAVHVQFEDPSILEHTYPTYKDGWQVTAKADGELSQNGITYNYLFWEGRISFSFSQHEGFVVKGDETASFLEDKLSEMGLLRNEANDFIVFWLPKLEKNPYNFIAFPNKAYAASVPLLIEPKPDSCLRIFMVTKALDAPIEVEAPTLEAFTREGFTVVEWGGTVLD